MNTSSTSDLRRSRRRVALLPSQDLVSVTDSSYGILSVAQPTATSADLQQWLGANRRRVEELLADRGAVLFRGFQIHGADEFHQVVLAWSPRLLNYTYGSTPRTRSDVAGVYTSTEYPADQTIPQHSEMAYARAWPRFLWFFCDQPAAAGGATPLTDCRRVAALLDPHVLRSFAEDGVRYVRNYGTGFDLSWQQAFETESGPEVEALCRAQDIEFTWYGEDRLRTSQVCAAVQRHPVTGAKLWFNQAHLFHTSALAAEVRTQLLSGDPAEIPRQAYYGNGESIADSVLDDVRAAYADETIREPWERGDVLLVDNMLVAHGRDPYQGSRRVLVAMTDEYSEPHDAGGNQR